MMARYSSRPGFPQKGPGDKRLGVYGVDVMRASDEVINLAKQRQMEQMLKTKDIPFEDQMLKYSKMGKNMDQSPGDWFSYARHEGHSFLDKALDLWSLRFGNTPPPADPRDLVEFVRTESKAEGPLKYMASKLMEGSSSIDIRNMQDIGPRMQTYRLSNILDRDLRKRGAELAP